MIRIVKSTPIRKDNKTYRVGSEFPYTDKDKPLLWNLTDKPNTKKTKPNPSEKIENKSDENNSSKK